ncbi:hypothetical protein G6L37_02890 [Agrobacterium rubi]|nr:hypothetical protein [Agrobacterium rubi]NTF24324.1 hypothetical protein [Agrobacterium rubi]
MAISSYKAQLVESGYEVTPDQRATHLHILNNTVPVKKDLDELVLFLGRHGAVDAEEAQKLREAVRILDGLLVPLALLKVVEDPRETAASLMFSSMLRGQMADDVEQSDEDDGPSAPRP